MSGDLVFSNAANRSIKFDATTTGSNGVSLSVVGNDSDGGVGGTVSITPGAATSGDKSGGSLALRTGNGFGGGASGSILIQPGQAGATGMGGGIQMAAADGGMTSGAGGPIYILSGSGTGTNASSGLINIMTGFPTGTGTVGAMNIEAGSSVGDDVDGGVITMRGGNTSGDKSKGGGLTFLAGHGTTTGAGGAVFVAAGKGGHPGGTGGFVYIEAGAGGYGSGTGKGGSLTLASGPGGGTSGASGNVLLDVGTGSPCGTLSIGTTNAPSAMTLGKSTMTTPVNVAANLSIGTTGKQLQVKGGAATDFIGQVSFVGTSSVVVANTNIAASDRIFLSLVDNGAAVRTFLSYAITAGTSFTIYSRDRNGTLTNITAAVNYFIVRSI